MSRSISHKLFSHGSIYTFSRLLNQSSRFILLPVYAHYLGKSGYGVVSLMWTFGSFLGFILLQGLHGAWFRFRFDYNTPQAVRTLESTILWYLLASGLGGVALLSLGGNLIAPVVTPGVPYFPLGLWSALTAAFLLVPNLLERRYQAEQQPFQFAVFTAARTLLNLLLIVIFLIPFGRGAEGKIEADLISAIIVAIFCICIIRPGGISSFSIPILKKCLRYGWPLIPHSLAGLTNEVIDRILISYLLGSADNGVYSMGYNIASIAVWIATGLNQSFSPLYIQQIKEYEHHRGESPARAAECLKQIARAGLQMVAFTGCTALFLTAVSREALALLPGTDFNQSWKIVAPVATGSLSLTMYFVFSQGIVYDRKRAGRMAYASIPAAAVNVLANLYLLPRVGIIGAAFATWLSNSVMMVIALVVSLRMSDVRYPWGKWIMVASSTLLGLAGLYILDLNVESIWIRMLTKWILVIFDSLFLLYLAGASRAALTALLSRKKSS